MSSERGMAEVIDKGFENERAPEVKKDFQPQRAGRQG